MGNIRLQSLRIAVVTKKRKSSDGYTKVGKLVQGTIIEDEDGNYKVSIDSDGNGITKPMILSFTPRSFEIVNRTNVFTKIKDERGNRIRIIRDKEKAKFMPGLIEQYTPFAKNWIVKGYIVKEGIIRMFDFKDLVGIAGYNMNVLHNE